MTWPKNIEDERHIKFSGGIERGDMAVCVVRGFGYAMLHVAELPHGQLWAFPPDRMVTASPVVALCGQRVRTAQPRVWVLRWKPASWPRVPDVLTGLDGHRGRVCTHCERALAARVWPGELTGLLDPSPPADPLRALAEALGTSAPA